MGVVINICGDFYISPHLNSTDYFDEDIIKLFNETDFNIVNLEGAAEGHVNDRITKTGPHLGFAPEAFQHLKRIRTDIVTLANNHIMDYGKAGLDETMMLCRDNGIRYVGAGDTPEEARKPIIIKQDNLRIAVLNFTEHEWSVADELKAGANPLNIVENISQIKDARESNDYVIVIVHGGHEHFHLPSPRMVSFYRFFADNGASVIVGHHTHCISGFEVYNEVPIFYGLGNFLFTISSEKDSANRGLVLKLKLKKDEPIQWELIPVQQDNKTYFLSKAEGNDKLEMLKEAGMYSEIISDDKLLKKSWNDFITESRDHILYVFSPINLISNRFIRGAIRRLGLDRYFIKKDHYLEMLNYIECESLLDVSTGVMKKMLTENENSNS